MARYTGPKNRIARRFGVNIFGRKRNPLLHKEHPPGMHGSKRKKKSDFGVQLEEKQKLRAVYGMLTQKALILAYKKALLKPGNTAQNFMENLESRLDMVVYRLRLAPTIFAAQQLVSHGHILVDNEKVDRRSFLVKPGMEVSVKAKSRQMKIVLEAQENTAREIPSYLMGADSKFSGKMLIAPQIDQIPLPLQINIPRVCEFLAHTN